MLFEVRLVTRDDYFEILLSSFLLPDGGELMWASRFPDTFLLAAGGFH